jgi:hypothetical protein
MNIEFTSKDVAKISLRKVRKAAYLASIALDEMANKARDEANKQKN